MALIVPLPKTHSRLLEPQRGDMHPGLLLDKYAASWDPGLRPGQLKFSEEVQKKSVQAVAECSRQPPHGLDFAALLKRWQATMDALQAVRFRATTTGPLTLHLARASALENAGICLHPVYGFSYLPGSGLKGMAHAYACELWLPTKQDKPAAWGTICRVFGWAASPWLKNLAKSLSERFEFQAEIPPDAHAADIVFHDAWPETWPRLTIDILNNHHSTYYQDFAPPGDWDSPIPVYFLSLSSGQTFEFGVSKRRGDLSDGSLDVAREWLVGALVYSGAGAKTATGYGGFKLQPDSEALRQTSRSAESTWRAAQQSKTRAEFAYTVELVTPAFLAGADQESADDCQLRPATLRGLLRWWWRTMHAGHVDAATLARLEAAVWGDTATGAAVRITAEPVSAITPLLYDKETLRQKNNLPRPLNKKTTQGLWYHSFGMDDKRKGHRRQRFYVAPGARWMVTLTARASSCDLRNRQGKIVRSIPLPAPDLVLAQAQAALWLLCHFGGLGSKSRRGFGCLAVPRELAEWRIQRCQETAAQLRKCCQLQSGRLAGSPALEQMLTIPDIATPWTNYWFALDQVAAVAQEFAQQHKHNLAKKALGLPRNVRPPFRGSFEGGPRVATTDRHASPVIYHLAPGQDGLAARVVAFPSPELPDDATLDKSRQFLKHLLEHLQRELPKRVSTQKDKGRTAPVNEPPRTAATQTGAAGTPPAASPLKSGDRLEAELVADPKGRNRRFARCDPAGLVGPIVNHADVPPEKRVGDKLTLIVHSISSDGKQIQFCAPPAAD